MDISDRDGADGGGGDCGCGAPGVSVKVKAVVCLLVGLVAAAIVARGIMKECVEANGCAPKLFTTELPVAVADEKDPLEYGAVTNTVKKEPVSVLWGKALVSLASLNQVAADKDAVFVLVASGGDEETKVIETEIEAAVIKIMAKGKNMGVFVLAEDAPDYVQLSNQVPVPCVLTMVKGGSVSVVAEDITAAKLIEALVTASRPADCGPAPADSSCCP